MQLFLKWTCRSIWEKCQFPQSTKLRGAFSIKLDFLTLLTLGDFLMSKYKCIFVYICDISLATEIHRIWKTWGHTVNTRIPFSPCLFKTARRHLVCSQTWVKKIQRYLQLWRVSKYKVSIYTMVNCVIKSNLQLRLYNSENIEHPRLPQAV